MTPTIPSNIILQKINYFNGVLDSSCATTVSIKAILNGIKEGKWSESINWYRHEEDDIEELKAIKKRFPGCTFSGTFNKRRFDNNLDQYTGLLVIDIDKKDLTMSYKKTIECLKQVPFIFCVFQSTGGEGMKALAYIGDQSTDHKVFFRGVEEYLFDEYGIKIDPSGKNVGRLCFISYDPELYLEFENKVPFSLDDHAPKTKLSVESEKFEEVGNSSQQGSDYETCHDLTFIVSIAVKWVENSDVGHYRKGNRNNFIFTLACIMNRAGVAENQTEHVIMGRFRSLGHKEVLTTVNSAYRHNKSEHGSKPIRQKVNNRQNRML